VMMEFADRWGHERAHQIVSEASRRAASRGTPFAVALLEDPAVAEAYEPDAVVRLVAAPEAYLGSSTS
jgi:adenylosuccinate lyase